MTLGAAAAGVRLIGLCRERGRQVEPDPAEMAARYGAETPVLDWRERLVCSRCGSRLIDMAARGSDGRLLTDALARRGALRDALLTRDRTGKILIPGLIRMTGNEQRAT